MPRLATSQANGQGSSSSRPHDTTGAGDAERKPPSGSNRSNQGAPRSNQGSARSNQGRSSGASCKPDDKKGSGKKDGEDDDGNNPGPGTCNISFFVCGKDSYETLCTWKIVPYKGLVIVQPIIT